MKLLIDVGNSRLKWALSQNKQLSVSQSLIYERERLAAQLTELGREIAQLPIQRVWIANVAGPLVAEQLSDWLLKQWKTASLFFLQTKPYACGVKNAYPQPERLGIDRWAALIAARQISHETACVINCGTAVTIDVLNTEGEHQGGLIAPGLMTMRRALRQSAYALREDYPDNSILTDFLARDTQTGIKMGTLYALSGLIDKISAELSQQGNQQIMCLLSGGDALSIAPLLRGIYRYIPDLVLQGIDLLAEEQVLCD